MTGIENNITKEYFAFLQNKAFPCAGAKAALAKQQVKCIVAGHMACPADDRAILDFLYDFVDAYRQSNQVFYSAAIIFQQPKTLTEAMFDELLWMRLQALANLDAKKYAYDKRVKADPSSPDFSFSIKEEAFFIIGLHPASSREARKFQYPMLAFNPHTQFEKLKETNKYQVIQHIARKKDRIFSGSVNPMLDDFGNSSEALQYSGQQYNEQWKCPLQINHITNEHHSTP